jgi:hypothetical protein
MSASSFPSAWPDNDPRAVTGYRLLPDGIFAAARRQALTAQADLTGFTGQMGLGWMLDQDKDVAFHPGTAPAAPRR